jgi:hypothetical protein
VMHPDLLNPAVKSTQYAVRGELYLRGEELRKAGKDIIFTNVGNPHALGAKPLTFTRQVGLCWACGAVLFGPLTRNTSMHNQPLQPTSPPANTNAIASWPVDRCFERYATVRQLSSARWLGVSLRCRPWIR